MQNNETRFPPLTVYENQFKIDQNLNVRPESMQLLEENIRETLQDISKGNDCLDKNPKAQVNKLDYIKPESFCRAKNTIS